ncbi:MULTISPECIES: hypothetical protein [Acinetobacter]|uniref:hypothetical protein n=1 Tax=Acinetobacter TaxID=469 RepID=UPI0007856E82|nr:MULTISPECIES: hypothetical protein [Acinetobacter]UBQ36435.1 hypothetical protein LCH18_09360 [Acinetobacter johnsonii]
MKIKIDSLLSIGIFMSRSTQAKCVIEGLHGALKLNPNMYAFGADEDNTISQENLIFLLTGKQPQPLKKNMHCPYLLL